MHPSGRLDVIGAQAERRLEYLHGLADSLPTVPDPSHDRVVAFVVIEALNTWASFCRSFYLSCVFRARRANGAKVALGKEAHIVTRDQAIEFAVLTVRGHSYVQNHRGPWKWRDEPKWYDPSVINNISPRLALSNLAQIQGAFGIPTVAFSEIPVFRNFFAHRNHDTASRVRSLITRSYTTYGFSRRTNPSAFLCARLPARPQNVLADYIDDIRNVTALMPQ
jgi:hypothetical protein